jgi:molecular chaperone DnaK (HSP70)
MATIYAVGIDFGTANSCVAYASYFDRGNGEVDPDPLHRPEVIPFFNRDTVPTAIHLGDGQQQPPTFGRMAEERGAVDPARLYTGFKLNLGHPERGRDAFLMAKYFLGYLRRRVEQFVPLGIENANERVETVVGHPVQWSADQREATLRAAQEAGFPNVRLEEESLAALYCHVFDEGGGLQLKPGSYVLTIDMGGGTTDFAFLQIPEQTDARPISIPVHPTPAEGLSYGGRDLDKLLLRHLSRGWDASVVNPQVPYLLREVRWFKEAFSSHITEGAFEYENKILVGDKVHRVRLTRDEFEHVAANYIKYFEVLVRGAVEEANLRPEQVTHIILTGGHSRWYFVERTLGNVFPHLWVDQRRTIFRHGHPEQSVARGLAYDPLARSNKGSFLAPMRRATHAVWMDIPGAEKKEKDSKAAALAKGAAQEPILLVPRGQLLPFRTTTPLKFDVDLTPTTGNETTVRVRFLSGHKRIPLADRVTTFEKSAWERFVRGFSQWLRLGGAKATDHFEISVDLEVDEHELILAELTVARFVGGTKRDEQKRSLQFNVGAAMAGESSG